LGSFVLSFLLGLLIFVHGFLIAGFFGGKGSLSLLDFADSFLSEGFLIFGSCVFHFFDVIEGDTFDCSLLSEDFVSFVFAGFSLF
jgi:hypothetical protein